VAPARRPEGSHPRQKLLKIGGLLAFAGVGCGVPLTAGSFTVCLGYRGAGKGTPHEGNS